MLKKGERAIIGIYNDFYSELLTQQQEEIIKMYYNEDLSITEISNIFNISRQAVLDSIKKSEEKLIYFENKLKIYEKTTKIKKILEDIKVSKNISKIDEIIRILEE